MSSVAQDIRRVVLGKVPLVYFQTWEEGRAIQLLDSFAAKVFKNDTSLAVWSCTGGFTGAIEDQGLVNPVDAVNAVINWTERGFFVLKDFRAFMDDPVVLRALRDAYQALQRTDKYLFVMAPLVDIPRILTKEIFLIEMPPPGEQEFSRLIPAVGRAYGSPQLDPRLLEELPVAFKGLTLNEARHSLERIFRAPDASPKEILDEVFVEKANIVKKSGVLEFVPPTTSIEDMGGLNNLKDWLIRRRELFSHKALEDGIPVPKGMLVMGISGCGKSFAVKAVSALWKVPLFRLDMSMVFSGTFGSPEATFQTTLRTIESLAPAILWIDEIENSLGMDEAPGQINSQIFSTFLTWMQEKPPLIFVAATANRIEALPAEILRKGRFDQIYFVDLPEPDERQEIFRIHLKRNGVDPKNFDFNFLSISTEGWNGAEIEQAVIAARVDAYSEGRVLNMDDIAINTSSMVPLSKTMAEQIKKIRAWAVRRATRASG